MPLEYLCWRLKLAGMTETLVSPSQTIRSILESDYVPSERASSPTACPTSTSTAVLIANPLSPARPHRHWAVAEAGVAVLPPSPLPAAIVGALERQHLRKQRRELRLARKSRLDRPASLSRQREQVPVRWPERDNARGGHIHRRNRGSKQSDFKAICFPFSSRGFISVMLIHCIYKPIILSFLTKIKLK